jgi:hypothetical protein
MQTGKEELGRWNRTARTGLPGRDCQDRTVRKGIQDMATRTGLSEQNYKK